MPFRLALGQVAIWEMLLAILILLASINGMARRAGGIYATSEFGRSEQHLDYYMVWQTFTSEQSTSKASQGKTVP
jgi:hypothetical protein